MLRHTLLVAVKVLLRRKGFTAVRLLVVVATIGFVDLAAGTMEVFIGVSPAHPEPSRLLLLGMVDELVPGARPREATLSLPLIESVTRDLPGVERVAIFAEAGRLRLDQGDRFKWARAAETDAAFFQVVPFEVIAGRTLAARPTTSEVVLSDETARSLFGAGTALGKTVRWTSGEGTVVGVVRKFDPPPGFPIEAGAWVARLPAGATPPRAFYGAFLLLARGTRAGAVQEAFAARLPAAPGAGALRGLPHSLAIDAVRLGPGVSETTRRVVQIVALGGGGLLVMFLPALALANVTLGALEERRREIGVRRAFGASSRQIALQVLVENMVLTSAGALVAAAAPLLAGVAGLGADEHLAFTGINRLSGAGWICLAVSTVVFGTVSGLLPAWRIARLSPLEAMRGGAR
jgi:putative ABC transport system permease protein